MIILNDKPGQLGNRIWSHVCFIALASETGNRLIIPFFWDYSSLFENLNVDPSTRFVPLRGYVYDKCLRCVFLLLRWLSTSVLPRLNIYVDREHWDQERWPVEVLKDPRKIVFLSGWNQTKPDIDLLAHHDLFRRIYRPRRRSAEKVDAALEERRRECDVIIGVHIRRGDYRHFVGGAYMFADSDYAGFLRQLLADERLKGKTVRFLMCSNEPIDLEAFRGLGVFRIAEAGIMEDLYGLSRCDYILGAPSSFSMWASFYGKVPLRAIKYRDETLDLSQFQPIVALSRFADGTVFRHVDDPGPG